MLARLIAGIDSVVQAAFGPQFMPFGPGTEGIPDDIEDDADADGDDEPSLDEILFDEISSGGDHDDEEKAPAAGPLQEDDGYPD